MDTETKKYLKHCVGLSGLLLALLWLRATVLEKDFSIRYKVDLSQNGNQEYIADTSLYHFSANEGKMISKSNFFDSHFLTFFPNQMGDWVGQDVSHSYADISKFKRFHNPKTKDDLWLILVHGSHPSQFHAAEVCYISDGWDVAFRDIKKIKMNDALEFPIRYAIAQKEGARHLIAYWYVFQTPSRKIEEGTLLFRISVELTVSEEKAQAALLDFIESLANVVSKDDAVQKSQLPALQEDVFLPNQRSLPPAIVKDKKLKAAKDKALQWMKDQQVPNHVVPYPEMPRRYLLLSYELNPKNPKNENDKSYPFIFSRAALYDNALAVIALTMAGEMERAKKIIDAVARMVETDGRLWFSYNTHNDWPNAQDSEGAIIRTGASAWMAYAILFYLKIQGHDAPQYLGLSEKITDWLLTNQVLDSSDPRRGLVTGGVGSHELQLSPKENKVVEVYHATPISWASIEHNIDLYFLLKDLVQITKKEKYKKALKILKEALLERAWDKKEGQFIRGLRPEGKDMAMALDCASWGAMLLKSMGETQKAELSLRSLKKYEVTDPIQSIKGYRPYYKDLVYDEISLNKIFYPHHPTKKWQDIEMVWSEGSLGSAMAYLKLNEIKNAKEVLLEMMKLQTQTGGLLYATKDIPFQFSTSPSMAGTAWFVMTVLAYENPALLEYFWD